MSRHYHGALTMLIAAQLCCASVYSAAQESLRQTVSFDQGWRFATGDHPGAEVPAFEDASWSLVDAPHDWAIEGPFDREAPSSREGGYLPTGVGWYRKSFNTPTAPPDARVFVEFDGVMANSDVWINGHHLGRRPSGYVSFRYELTDHLMDGENVLAVRADTAEQVASRWYTGSGIYRHVRLVAVPPIHIDYHGLFVSTPRVDQDRATISCEIEVRNQSGDSERVTLRTELFDPSGVFAGVGETPVTVNGNGVAKVVTDIDISTPQLWDVENPQLYRAVCQVMVDGQQTDEVSVPFGVRIAEFRSDSGFWLNGRTVKIKGVCLHHCAGAVGAAVPLDLWEHRLRRLQEFGVNAVRTAHNPVAPEFLDLCDRMGVLVMNEFFDCWTKGKRRKDYHLHFEEWSHRDMHDTIRRDRNHPCVVLYSVGNEIHDTPKEELAKRVLSGLVPLCHETDPTRPVTQALFRPNVSHDYDNGLADMLDVIGTNYRDLELLQAWRDNPQRKIIGTEQTHDRKIWLACRDHIQHAGQFLWVGIDYLGESHAWPITTFNSGLLDRSGRPYPRAYERRSWWSDQPMVAAFRRVAPTEPPPVDPGYEEVEWKRRQVLFSDWTPKDSESHEELVEVFSNCEEVELFLNDDSLGAKPLPRDARPRNWKVAFVPGELKAVGKNEGEEVASQVLRTAEGAAKIQLETSAKTLASGFDHVAVIEAVIVDSAGTPLPRATHKVSFRVEGPGEVIAVDNGSIFSHELFQTNERTTYLGRCIAIVRATADAGEIVVVAESDGLGAGSVRIQAGPESPQESQP